MTVTSFFYLLAAGVAAGLLSSMAGLASLVSYPVLLSLGVPPVNANVTNTAALIFNGLGSGLSSLRELRAHPRITLRVTVWALLGGLVGSLILAFAPATTFEKVVPFLILLAALLMLWSARPQSQRAAASGGDHRVGQALAVLAVGVYIGYFGASAGIIMLSILSLTLTVDFATSNAIKNFACFATNVMALVIYMLTTRIYWLMVVPLGAGMFVGGFLGPIVVRHVSAQLLRLSVAIAALGLAGYLFYGAYG
ncbi:sulfite exporter TauE/SafE family protein [Lacticaseibacillus absianus]|uniref:sulfite exporter TauE/SafE family protein n=1 Tax=Lacticaseibacillus absianus TaxID=2729623 RepID=UPI0015C6DDEC|nr:sulfite exporter TauE/SafE family protein [Lacticaseibacillus absianus]